MASSRKIARWILRKLRVVVVIAVLLRVGVGVYICTAHGRAFVAGQIGSQIGLPVVVADVNPGWGWGRSSITFRILDPALADAPNADILSVEQVSADVTLASVLTGHGIPSDVRISGVHLRLRLAADGTIHTTLPKLPESSGGGDETKIPRVVLEDARVSVHQDGRPVFTLGGLTLRAEPDGDRIAWTGSVDDSVWGRWKLSGEVNAKTEAGWIEIEGDTTLTTDQLRSVPSLPPSVWESVQLDGRCKVVGRLVIGPGEPLKYDVTVRAEGVTLRAPAAEIDLTDLTGTIHAHDGRVEIRGLDDQPRATGALAGGAVGVSGSLDFGTMPAVIDPLEVDVKGVAVRQLPASWGVETARGKLPGKLSLRDGLASGTARLRVVVTEQGGIECYGLGTATFEIPTFAGGSARVIAKVGGEGKKLDFTPSPPAPEALARAERVTREWRVGPTVWPYHTTQLTAIDQPHFGDLVPVLALTPVEMETTSDAAGLEATLDLKDVDLAQVVELLELKLPGETSGRASVHAKLDVPLSDVTNPAAFRLTGRVSSSELQYGRLTVRDLGARLDGRGGTMTLTAFRGSVSQAGVPDAPVGTFDGTASVALDPPGPVTANLTLDALPVAALLGAVPGPQLEGSGFVSGRAEFHAPLATVADPATWRARAVLASNGVQVAGRTATGIHLAVVATDGTATLTDTRLTVEGIPVAADGTLGLTGKRSFTAALRTVSLDTAALRKVAHEFGIPGEIEGSLEVEGKFAGTLLPLSLNGFGRVSSPELRLERLIVRDLAARLDGRGGTVELTQFRGSVSQAGVTDAPVGTFAGTASAALDPPGPVIADLTLHALPVAALLGAVPGLKVDGSGLVSGRADFRAPLTTIADPATWRARAVVASNGVQVAGRTATGIHLAVVAADGTATLTDTRLTVEGIPVAADGTLGLTGKRSFTAALKTTGTSIADLKKLASKAKLPVEVDGELDTVSKVVGTLSPMDFKVLGTIRARDVKIGKSVANTFAADWEATGERLKVPKLDVSIFDGTITGALDLPFADDGRGTFGLTLKDIDTAPVAAAIPGFKRRVEGHVGGKLTGSIAPANEGGDRLGDVELSFDSPSLRVEAVDPKRLAPIENVAGRVTFTNGVLGYHLTADIAKGKLVVDRPTTEKGSAEPGRGSLQLTEVDLTQLGKDLVIDFLRPIRGKFNVSFDHDANFTDGEGKVSVRELAWGREEVPSELSGALTLRDGELTLSNFGGPFARGLLRARAKMRLDDPSRNSVTLAINQADAKRLLAPVPEAADLIDGKVTINMQVKVGDIQHASGTVVLTRGSVAGISLPELRLPVDLLSYPGGYGRLTIREATARAGTGRATASATVQWGSGTRVEGKVQFVKLPLRSLAPSVGNSSFLGGGRLTGRFDIAGSNVRSADDLTGKLVARLDDATVGELPLLRQTIPYLNTIGVTKPFDTGDVEANLSRGVFRVQRLAMSNPSAQLFASGTVTLAGRLDVDVTAHTGDVGPNQGAVQILARAIPAVGPIPIGLISDVTAFLSDRTVKLNIGGTAASPKIRLNTASLLREEAVRFFIKRYVPPSVTNALSAGGLAGMAQEQIKK